MLPRACRAPASPAGPPRCAASRCPSGPGRRSRFGPLTSQALRRRCLDFPEAVEEFPFAEGVSVFKVRGKMFALSSLASSPLAVSLKCEPEIAEQLRASHPAVAPGYHLNKRHWNTVTIDGSLEDSFISDLIEDSYDLVVAGLPKRVQAELGWPPAGSK